MQKNVPRLRVKHLTEGSRLVREIKDLNAVIRFNAMKGDIVQTEIWKYSDAAFNIIAGRDCAKTGMLTGLTMVCNTGEKVVRLTNWNGCKQL